MDRHPTRGHTTPWHDRRRRRRAAARGALATTVGVFATVALAGLTRSTWQGVGHAPGPADAVQVTAVGLATLAAAWLTVLLALTTAGLLPGTFGAWGRRVGAFLAPGPCLRLTTVLLGAGLAVTGTSVPATAAPAGVTVAAGAHAPGPAPTPAWPDPAFAPQPGSDAPDAGCLPTPGWQPAGAAVRRSHSDVSLLSRCPEQDDPARWVVHRGDTLWGIAARHLGDDATPAEVARAWPHWYAANRDVIGDDPDLLLPGQVLTAPEEVAR